MCLNTTQKFLSNLQSNNGNSKLLLLNAKNYVKIGAFPALVFCLAFLVKILFVTPRFVIWTLLVCLLLFHLDCLRIVYCSIWCILKHRKAIGNRCSKSFPVFFIPMLQIIPTLFQYLFSIYCIGIYI